MVNKDALNAVLIMLANTCKITAEENSVLAVEVASLRHSLDALLPKFSETFQKMKKENQSQASQTSPGAVESIDQIIRKLKDGEVL